MGEEGYEKMRHVICYDTTFSLSDLVNDGGVSFEHASDVWLSKSKGLVTTDGALLRGVQVIQTYSDFPVPLSLRFVTGRIGESTVIHPLRGKVRSADGTRRAAHVIRNGTCAFSPPLSIVSECSSPFNKGWEENFPGYNSGNITTMGVFPFADSMLVSINHPVIGKLTDQDAIDGDAPIIDKHVKIPKEVFTDTIAKITTDLTTSPHVDMGAIRVEIGSWDDSMTKAFASDIADDPAKRHLYDAAWKQPHSLMVELAYDYDVVAPRPAEVGTLEELEVPEDEY
jgi:hypothetical protein